MKACGFQLAARFEKNTRSAGAVRRDGDVFYIQSELTLYDSDSVMALIYIKDVHT